MPPLASQVRLDNVAQVFAVPLLDGPIVRATRADHAGVGISADQAMTTGVLEAEARTGSVPSRYIGTPA